MIVTHSWLRVHHRRFEFIRSVAGLASGAVQIKLSPSEGRSHHHCHNGLIGRLPQGTSYFFLPSGS